MWGAIIGDLAGSIYEYDQVKEVKSVNVGELIKENSFYSDDTILTIAILDAMLTNKDFEKKLKLYTSMYYDYHPKFNPYFKRIFSQNFVDWTNNVKQGNSKGNGAMMRISPVGYLSKDENDLLLNAFNATYPSHNDESAIYYSYLVARIIYLSRIGLSKNDIKDYLNLKYDYKPFDKFNTTCNETINNCLYATFESDSFEESLRTVISFGGDTDTNAAIVGSMAESMYGIDYELIAKAKKKIPKEFNKKLTKGYSRINSR